jgi:hypothetical protein
MHARLHRKGTHAKQKYLQLSILLSGLVNLDSSLDEHKHENTVTDFKASASCPAKVNTK